MSLPPPSDPPRFSGSPSVDRDTPPIRWPGDPQRPLSVPLLSLADLLQNEPPPWPESRVRHVVADILLALARVHADGNTHGDLTNSAVFLENDGTVRFDQVRPGGDPRDDIRAAAGIVRQLLGDPSDTPPEITESTADQNLHDWLERASSGDPTVQLPSAVAALAAWSKLNPAHSTSGNSLPTSNPPRHGLRHTLVILACGACIAAAVWLTPKAQQEWNRVQQTRATDALLAQARKELADGRFATAAQTARDALQIQAGHPAATQIIAEAGKRLESEKKRRDTAEKALAEAKKRLVADDIPAALAAYHAIRDNPANPQSAIDEANRRILELRNSTGTLLLPPDWPEDARIRIDDQPGLIENQSIPRVLLGRHRVTVTREGFRAPPPVEIEFRGLKPVRLPVPEWHPLGGKLAIESHPAGAAVWINNSDTGQRTPCTLDDVGPGEVEFILKLEGHFPATVSGDVPAAGLLEKSVTLKEMPRVPLKDGTKAGERAEFDLAPNLRVAFRWCPPGTFPMGGSDPGAQRNELPTRLVRLSKGFWLGETEVTQSQWQAVTGQSMTFLRISAYPNATLDGEGPDHPVYFVSWEQICGDGSSAGFLGKVNDFLKANGGDRWVADLPTEAQWEYACRAGSQTAFANQIADPVAIDRLAWHASNSQGTTHPAAGKQANAWGFFDMHGNVLEWCRDWYQDHYLKLATLDPFGPASGWKKVVRGGSRATPPQLCRSAARGQASTSAASSSVGFRLALRSRENPPPAAQSPAKQPAKKPATPPARGNTKAKPKPKPKNPPRR